MVYSEMPAQKWASHSVRNVVLQVSGDRRSMRSVESLRCPVPLIYVLSLPKDYFLRRPPGSVPRFNLSAKVK